MMLNLIKLLTFIGLCLLTWLVCLVCLVARPTTNGDVGVGVARGAGLSNLTNLTNLTNLAPLDTPTPPPCGLAWRVVPSPNRSSETNLLSDLAAVSSTDVWAVGLYDDASLVGHALIMHWDGVQWSVVDWSDPAAYSPGLGSIDALSANDIWAVGFRGGGGAHSTLAVHWDGTLWSRVTSPNPSYNSEFKGVDALSANDVWAVGSQIIISGGFGIYQTLTEHWDGEQWSVVPSPNVGTRNNILQDVAAISSDDVWAIGSYSSMGLDQALLLHWDGEQWSVVKSPEGPHYQPYAVTAISAKDVWVVGSRGGGGTLILHWDGVQWSVVSSPNPGFSNYLFGATSTGPDDVWAVGSRAGNGTLVEHWDGKQWSVVKSPNVGTNPNFLSGVAAVSAEEVWAVGDYQACGFGCDRTLIMRYSDPCTASTPSPTSTVTATATATATRVSTSTSTSTSTATPTHMPTHTPTLTVTLTGTPAPTTSSTPCVITFTDVHPTDYFYEPVRYLYCRGVISGYADGTFRPYNLTTRAQLAKIVVLAEGFTIYTPPTPTFRDVPTPDPFYTFVETAYHQGIISGYTCGTNCLEYRPGNNVTRGQLCKIVVLAEAWPIYTPPVPTFRDVANTDPFYGHIETAYNRGIISGYTCGAGCLEFRPGNNATRGQICKIVYLAVTVP